MLSPSKRMGSFLPTLSKAPFGKRSCQRKLTEELFKSIEQSEKPLFVVTTINNLTIIVRCSLINNVI